MSSKFLDRAVAACHSRCCLLPPTLPLSDHAHRTAQSQPPHPLPPDHDRLDRRHPSLEDTTAARPLTPEEVATAASSIDPGHRSFFCHPPLPPLAEVVIARPPPLVQRPRLAPKKHVGTEHCAKEEGGEKKEKVRFF
jgi:hypothetical protein